MAQRRGYLGSTTRRSLAFFIAGTDTNDALRDVRLGATQPTLAEIALLLPQSRVRSNGTHFSTSLTALLRHLASRFQDGKECFAVAANPRGCKYQIFKDSGPKHHQDNGFLEPAALKIG